MKCDFVNIEESVREPYVPNLPGVQPRRRFFFNELYSKYFISAKSFRVHKNGNTNLSLKTFSVLLEGLEVRLEHN